MSHLDYALTVAWNAASANSSERARREAEDAMGELASMRAEIAEYREALKPFDAFATALDENEEPDESIVADTWLGKADPCVRAKDFRFAAAVLAKYQKEAT